jgi:hypothetical protein
LSAFGIIHTSPNSHTLGERREKSTAQKTINTAERMIVFRKNQNVPLTTPDTFSQRVIGVTKKSNRVKNLATQSSVPLFSTTQFPKNTVRVVSANIKVVSWIKR